MLHRIAFDNKYKVGELESEMVSIETMMGLLIQRRALVRRKINALSPTARLPPEILTEIFQVTCQRVTESEASNVRITPLFLGSVCKGWREIAWSTPLLWNRLTLHASEEQYGTRALLLQEWLFRAQTSPLFIMLTLEDEQEATICSLRAIMGVLVTRSMYWHTFESLLPSQCHDILQSCVLPNLVSVAIHPPKGAISTFSDPPDIFLTASKLLRVDLSGYNFSAMLLPWGQLERFRTQFLTVSECLKILQRSPNMTECYLENVYSPASFMSTGNVEHSQLQRLDFVPIKAAGMSLLDNVSLPALRQFQIYYNGNEHIPLSSISSLVSRSCCNLRRLAIENCYSCDMDDLIQCLEAIPSVTDLRVDLSNIEDRTTGLTSRFIASLACTNERPFLPNLITFVFSGQVFCQSTVLLNALVSRWKSESTSLSLKISNKAQLKFVDINASHRYDLNPDAKGKLRNLVEEGMEISVQCFMHRRLSRSII
ncbi:hypothetical protein B0H34DRAFT_650704 [Crassisporium funariophilum]|nr:hypothetical protein B0H34DRAFT_650704 [Crassisporium funariophilum]